MAASPDARGVLHVVATPIGNLADLSPRAQQVLRDVDAICAEDTRHTRALLAHFGIDTPALALHEHNEEALAGRVVARLLAGESLALVSDAGTPLVSDPGFVVARAAIAADLPVHPIPGPSSLLAALCIAGLPADLPAGDHPQGRNAQGRRDQRGDVVDGAGDVGDDRQDRLVVGEALGDAAELREQLRLAGLLLAIGQQADGTAVRCAPEGR